jgi:hypothetical protein
MNPIDKMLLKHSFKIQVFLFPNPILFDVVFSALPSQQALEPVLALINTERFDWQDLTKIKISNSSVNQLMVFGIKQINVIPVSDAVLALTEIWEGLGYDVAVSQKYLNTTTAGNTQCNLQKS